MKRNMAGSYRDYFMKNNRAFIPVLILLFLSIAAGGFYCTVMGKDGCESVRTYLEQFIKNASAGMDSKKIFTNSIKDYAVLFGIVFMSGFFKLGVAATGACVVKKGFAVGFTAASFIKIYGWAGMLGILATLGGILIFVPAFTALSCFSAKLSVTPNELKKNFYFSYIFLGIVCLSIFCGAALFDANVTTIFMKWVSGKLI